MNERNHFTSIDTNEGTVTMTAAAAASSERPRIGKNLCLCGRELPPPRPVGRPRLACSLPCSRKRDHLQRMIRYRLEALPLWRAELGQGRYPRARVRAEIRQVKFELALLDQQLRGDVR